MLVNTTLAGNLMRRVAQLQHCRTLKRGQMPEGAFPASLKAKHTGLAANVHVKGHVEPYMIGATRLSSTPEGAIPVGANTTWQFTKKASIMRELWAMWACYAAWLASTFGIIYWSLSKHEIWVDRSKELPPWDWERVRDHYHNQNKKLWKNPREFERNHILEQLQDEMIAAAKERGTR